MINDINDIMIDRYYHITFISRDFTNTSQKEVYKVNNNEIISEFYPLLVLFFVCFLLFLLLFFSWALCYKNLLRKTNTLIFHGYISNIYTG